MYVFQAMLQTKRFCASVASLIYRFVLKDPKAQTSSHREQLNRKKGRQPTKKNSDLMVNFDVIYLLYGAGAQGNKTNIFIYFF